jgi:hypothetical protein
MGECTFSQLKVCMSFEHPVGKNNREKIIQVVIDLGGERILPKQIKAKLDEKARIKARNLPLSEREKLERIKKRNHE